MSFRSWSFIYPFLCVMFALTPPALFANHGPGASGGGSSTLSGETLKHGHFELSLREDYAQFEHFSASQAQSRAAAGGDFDALDHGLITTVDLSYGLTDDLQIGGSIGYFAGSQFIGADRAEDGSVESSTTNPDGLTDLALAAKYRLLQGQPGNLSVVSGVILPT